LHWNFFQLFFILLGLRLFCSADLVFKTNSGFTVHVFIDEGRWEERLSIKSDQVFFSNWLLFYSSSTERDRLANAVALASLDLETEAETRFALLQN